MPDFKPEPKDVYGLPKISIDGGKPEATDRGATRAPILIGGTVTGKQFQTDAVDPRITIDSTAMICHNSSGTTTFQLDIATGNVTIIGGTITGATFQTSVANPKVIIDPAGFRAVNASGQNAVNITAGGSIDILYDPTIATGVRWLSPAAVVLGTIQSRVYEGANSLVMESTDPTVLSSLTTLGNPALGGTAYVKLVSDVTTPIVRLQASVTTLRSSVLTLTPLSASNSQFSISATDSIRVVTIAFTTAVGSINTITNGDTTARVRFGNPSADIDILGTGKIVYQGTNLFEGTGAGAGNLAGAKGVAAVAAHQWGNVLRWRHVRCDTNGNAVVPGSVTLGTVNTNVNSNTPQISTLQASGGHFKVQATAAGSFEYMAAWTVN